MREYEGSRAFFALSLFVVINNIYAHWVYISAFTGIHCCIVINIYLKRHQILGKGRQSFFKDFYNHLFKDFFLLVSSVLVAVKLNVSAK